MPGAGDLRDRYRFDQRSPDANGDRLGEFEPGFAVAARTTWLRGTEAVMGQRLEGKQPVVITIRDSQQTRAITNAFRAVNARDATKVFNITSVAPAKERGFIDILATTGGAAG